LKKESTPSRKTISSLILKLESAHNALEGHHNFNLAEVHISEYYEEIPQGFLDQKITKSFLNALKKRDPELFLACIEAEIERLEIEKIKLLRLRLTQF